HVEVVGVYLVEHDRLTRQREEPQEKVARIQHAKKGLVDCAEPVRSEETALPIQKPAEGTHAAARSVPLGLVVVLHFERVEVGDERFLPLVEVGVAVYETEAGPRTAAMLVVRRTQEVERALEEAVARRLCRHGHVEATP